MTRAVLTGLLLAALSTPVLAAPYPVVGKWGQSASADKGPIDCAGKRIIAFNGETRTDSRSGVPAYRNRSVTADGPARFKIVDEFTTGQISNGHTTFVLRKIDPDHIELNFEPGGLVKLQRCK
jgi:hypothetical protein